MPALSAPAPRGAQQDRHDAPSPGVTRQLAPAKAAAASDHVRATPWLTTGRTGGAQRHLDDRTPTATDVREALGR
jgi:hypothetical protein